MNGVANDVKATISVRIPSNMLHAVKRVAQEQDRSISWIVVQALRIWLAPHDDSVVPVDEEEL